MKRERVPLTVDVLFYTDGRLLPRRLYYDGRTYKIDRILGVQPFCPPGVGCIAPLRYTVEIEGKEKELYYEADTNLWFSVRDAYG